MKKEIDKIIRRALQEDNIDHDITTNILVAPHQTSYAYIIAREDCILSGLDIVTKIFSRLDPDIKLDFLYKNGDRALHNTKIVKIYGKTRAILTGERVVLNFMAYLSGVATLTGQFVRRASPYKAQIMDTRKTIPGLRAVVKMAVRHGGGVNHRFDLKEMVIIKDNHQIAYHRDKTIEAAVSHVRRRTHKKIVMEVDTLIQFKEALNARPDIILLDNMTARQMQTAVVLNKKAGSPCLLEASGGINLRNIRSVAGTGVDRISIGALTHSSRAIDFSLEFMSHSPARQKNKKK